MFNKFFVFAVLISAVAAELAPGLYRILNPEINSAGFVAKAGGEIGTPTVLSLSQPSDLRELVSIISPQVTQLILMRSYSG